MPPSTTKKQRNQHKIRVADVEPENKKLKSTLELHIRVMLASMQANIVPELPTFDHISAFETGRYRSADDLDALTALLEAGYSSIIDGAITAVNSVRALAFRTNSIIAKNVLAIDEHFLRVIYSGIISAGLSKWRPDVLGNFGSMYNRVHERIAIKTFQEVAISHCYSRLSPDLTNLGNMQLLEKFYRNYIFSYIYGLAKKEMKAAGSVQRSINNTNAYKRRMEPKCHSDDELSVDPNGKPCYIIHDKPGRNPSITTFFCHIDAQRWKIKLATQKAGQLIHERRRVAMPDIAESAISQCFPTDVLLDWFKPAYFNALPAALRSRYAEANIALPLEEDWYQQESKTMKRNTFMKK
ncbi:hypothetical protein DFH09DRAFT_1301601 [Mycena vulgaris]|nr:hypothetical protein DFH09DRAFT_1301601 [Mycena vulgaris]